MSKILKRQTAVLAALAWLTGNALAAQGPGVGTGTATVTQQIWVGAGVIAVLLIGAVLARRGQS